MNDAPIGRTVVLNKGFVDSLSKGQLQAYVQVLVDASENHPDADKEILRKELERSFQRIGVEISPVEIDRTAEQLVGEGAAPLTISTNDGTILFEREERSSAEPTQETHADPADPERPLYS